MKKFLAICLSICTILIYACTPALAAEDSNSVEKIAEVNAITEENSEGPALFKVTVTPNGNSSITPYNVDLTSVQGPYWQNYVHVSKGKNMKVHVYIESFAMGSNSVDIYVKPNSAAGAKDSKYKVATWTGKGHHWAELAMNTQYTTYYVMLWGAFNGSGGIYTEP